MAYKKAVAVNELIVYLADNASKTYDKLVNINEKMERNVGVDYISGNEVREAIQEIKGLKDVLNKVKNEIEARDYDSKLVKLLNEQRSRADGLSDKVIELQNKYNSEITNITNIENRTESVSKVVEEVVYKVIKASITEDSSLLKNIADILENQDKLLEIVNELKNNSNVPSSSFENNIRRIKDKTYKPALKANINDDELVKAYQSGITPYKIAKQVGCTQQTVINRLKGLGIYKNRS